MDGTPCGLGVGESISVCHKLVGGTPSGLGVGGPLVCESFKLVGGTPCGLGVGGQD